MQRSHTAAAYVWIVLGTILVFFWLKKYTFLPEVSFLRFTYTTLGLSYIFFRVMQMIIDANAGDASQKTDVISYLNFTLSFTTLVSGPIQRYPEFIEQHLAPVRPPLTIIDMGDGLQRIIAGFFKVNVLGLIFSMTQRQAIDALSPQQSIGSRVLSGATIAASYTIYLFVNFSGYTDIVIGIARFLRIRLPENFNRPFSADNFLEFWNRWHMTLSHWLKTYVYNPLLIGLMRRFPSAKIEPFLAVCAFFVTFFLIGLWHGQTSEFIFYGILLGAGVSFNKLYQIQMAKVIGKKQYKALCKNWAYQTVCRGLTFTFFSFSLLWFWSNWTQLRSLAHSFHPREIALIWIVILVASSAILALWESAREWGLSFQFQSQPLLLSRYFRTAWNTALVVVVSATTTLLNAPAPDIVYKAF
jgi:D-alanyl-lipoteichoic acid acyltransferase DltB (MBOAT superfamily)